MILLKHSFIIRCNWYVWFAQVGGADKGKADGKRGWGEGGLYRIFLFVQLSLYYPHYIPQPKKKNNGPLLETIQRGGLEEGWGGSGGGLFLLFYLKLTLIKKKKKKKEFFVFPELINYIDITN